MRRVVIYISAAAMSFVVGVLAYRLRPVTLPDPNLTAPVRVSACELQINPHSYVGKVVVVRAALYRVESYTFIHDASCVAWDKQAPPVIRVSDEGGVLPVLPEWARDNIKSVYDFNGRGDESGADVILTGTFSEDYSRPDISPNSPHFRINARSFLQLSPSATTTPHSSRAASPPTTATPTAPTRR